jgi:hypothetical protein
MPPEPPQPPQQPTGEEGPREPYVRIERIRRAVVFARDRLAIPRVEIPVALQLHGMHIVNAVLEPLFMLEQAAAPMPQGLVFSGEWFASREGTEFAAAAYAPSEGQTLFINPSLLLWDEEARRRAFEARDLSTPDLRGTSYHEYLHHWAYSNNAADYFMLQTGMALAVMGIDTADFTRRADLVSEYATASPLEFLSEVYAALRTSVAVALEALALYNQLLLRAPPVR